MEPVSQTQQVKMDGLEVMSPPANIFVSYASDAGEWADRFTSLLVRPHSQVDSAPVDTYGGSDDERRARRHRGYAAVVVLITPGYVATRAAEIDLATFVEQGTPLVPIYGVLLQETSLEGFTVDGIPLQGLLRMVPEHGPVLDASDPERILAVIAAEIRKGVDANASQGHTDPSADAPLQKGLDPDTPDSLDPSSPLSQLLAKYRAFGSVTAVIRRAAEYAAAASPPAQLGTSLILVVFAELGTPGTAPAWAADWLRARLGDRFDELRSDYFQKNRIPGEFRPGGQPSGLRSGVEHTLRRASELARKTTGVDEIRARHLLAALLTDPRPEAGAVKRLQRMELDLRSLRKDLYGFVRGYGDDDDAWGEVLLENVERDTRLAGFHADDSQSPDYLGVKADADAFAKLIAARTVTPPLSIGLFGEWGSGKTYFMRMLQGEVARLAQAMDDADQMQRDLPYWKRIIQIEFNAWHYVEGNLWASLVQHIFENLRAAGDEDGTRSVSQELRDHLLGEIGHQKQAELQAQRERDQAQQLVGQAQGEVAAARTEFETQAAELARLSAANFLSDVPVDDARDAAQDALTALGLTNVGTSAVHLRAALGEARALLGRGRTVVAPLLYAQDRGRRLAYLLMALFAGPALAVGLGWLLGYLGQQRIAGIGALSGGVAGFLSTSAVWLRAQLTRADTWIRQIETAQRELDDKVARAQAASLETVRAAEEKLRLAEADYQAAKRKEAEAQRRAAEAEQRLKEASITELLTDFVETRANSNDYRKHLGTLALVRTDFERLSHIIEEQNWRLSPPVPGEDTRRRGLEKIQTLEQEEADRARRINRIVLYIDDLDRCPPVKVVEVLQAVHLLLAFPLFVVVVGVDARWVVRSVESRYRELLRNGNGNGNGAGGREPESNEFLALFGTATAHDYLEKIFQVPFWLRPMTDRACQAMVRGLLAAGIQPDANHANGTDAAHVTDGINGAHSNVTPNVATPAASPAPGADSDSTTTSAPADTTAYGGTVETPPPDATTAGDPAANVSPSTAESADAVKPAELQESSAAGTKDGGNKETGSGKEDAAEDLSPEALLIYPDEIAAIEAFAPLLGRSPRALKRFVNVYRLIKASLTPYERLVFRSEEALPDYLAVLFLLAVDTGAPAAAPAIFRGIRELSAPTFFRLPEEMRLARGLPVYEPGGSLPTLADLVERLDHEPELKGEPDWARVRQWLVLGEDRYRLPGDLGRLGRWVPRVSRYSFHTGRMAKPRALEAPHAEATAKAE